jgi:hypothetical protein
MTQVKNDDFIVGELLKIRVSVQEIRVVPTFNLQPLTFQPSNLPTF